MVPGLKKLMIMKYGEKGEEVLNARQALLEGKTIEEKPKVEEKKAEEKKEGE